MSTGRLNEAVKRNAARFPEDFMLQLKRRGNPKLEIAKCDLKLGAAGAIEFGNSVPETGKNPSYRVRQLPSSHIPFSGPGTCIRRGLNRPVSRCALLRNRTPEYP